MVFGKFLMSHSECRHMQNLFEGSLQWWKYAGGSSLHISSFTLIPLITIKNIPSIAPTPVKHDELQKYLLQNLSYRKKLTVVESAIITILTLEFINFFWCYFRFRTRPIFLDGYNVWWEQVHQLFVNHIKISKSFTILMGLRKQKAISCLIILVKMWKVKTKHPCSAVRPL